MESLDFKNLILNNAENNPKMIKNTIIALGKMFIYRKRCLKESLNFQAFKNYVQDIEKIEKTIAREKGYETQHKIKWEAIIL